LSIIRPGMRAGLVVLAVVVVLLIGFVMWGIGVQNQLVRLEQDVNEKWAQVQNVYQRRADLIPNLVETVRGFAAQERTVLTEVTQARANATSIRLTPEALNDPQAMQKFAAAQGQLTGALSRLLVTVERYPELKSNQNFLTLQSQLEGTENRVTIERQRYNTSVRDYNTRLRTFPASLVAGVMGFKSKAFFEAAPGSETAPKVRF
jgi:LemA protein